MKVFARLDLQKIKSFAKISKVQLPRLFRIARFLMENNENFVTVSFASFSPRNTILALTVLIFALEQSNFETKSSNDQIKIAEYVLEVVSSTEIMPNVKARKKWSKRLKNCREDSQVKLFAKEYDFSL